MPSELRGLSRSRTRPWSTPDKTDVHPQGPPLATDTRPLLFRRAPVCAVPGAAWAPAPSVRHPAGGDQRKMKAPEPLPQGSPSFVVAWAGRRHCDRRPAFPASGPAHGPVARSAAREPGGSGRSHPQQQDCDAVVDARSVQPPFGYDRVDGQGLLTISDGRTLQGSGTAALAARFAPRRGGSRSASGRRPRRRTRFKVPNVVWWEGLAGSSHHTEKTPREEASTPEL